ncbi:MAG TPA: N-6 DNA methylase [Candidatus Obscuribacterales bacterium]
MSNRLSHNQEFALVNRLVRDLKAVVDSARCAAVLPKATDGRSFAEPDNFRRQDDAANAAVVVAALAALGFRNLCPRNIHDQWAGDLVCSLAKTFGHRESVKVDATSFASIASAGLEAFTGAQQNKVTENVWLSLSKPLNTLFDNFAKKHDRGAMAKVLADPLFAGRVYECAAQEAKNQAAGDRLAGMAERGNLENIRRRTQWFTPPWIADFLITETIHSENGTFIDPACGAGHLLIPAMQRLVVLKTAAAKKRAEALASILESQLYGIDIDPQMVALSSLAIYLACRDLAPVIELPAPHILSFTHVDDGQAELAWAEARSGSSKGLSPGTNNDHLAGSLWLAVSRQKRNIALQNVHGQSVPLSVVPANFDALATNPPYMSHRTMPEFLSRFLRQHYPAGTYDLYAAFIQLSMRLLGTRGRASLICQQSFLSIQRYHRLRQELFDSADIISIVQLGSGAFPARAGEKVNNAIITFANANKRTNGNGSNHNLKFARILSKSEKEKAQEVGIAALLERKEQSCLNLDAHISRAPVAWWCPAELASLFQRHPPLQDKDNNIIITNGLFTCNNKRFLRHHQDVPPDERSEYVPYDKGGGQKWFRTTPYLLHWVNGGENIRDYRQERGQARSLPGEAYYFQNGVTYSYIGTRGFKARLLSPQSVFDIASSAIFSRNLSLEYLLGFLNSALVRFLLGVLNPTINFQIGDLRRLPLCVPSAEQEASVSKLASRAVAIAKHVESFDRDSPRYLGPALMRYGCDLENEDNRRAAYQEHSSFLTRLNAEEQEIQRLIDEEIFNLYSISNKARAIVYDDPWVTRGHNNVFSAPSFQKCLDDLRVWQSDQHS